MQYLLDGPRCSETKKQHVSVDPFRLLSATGGIDNHPDGSGWIQKPLVKQEVSETSAVVFKSIRRK